MDSRTHSDVTGIPAEKIVQAATLLAKNKPGTVVWALGITQHTTGTSNTRILPILQLALGNMGKKGGGCNIIRGHDNVQGSTDMCCLADSLPGYYGLPKVHGNILRNHGASTTTGSKNGSPHPSG